MNDQTKLAGSIADILGKPMKVFQLDPEENKRNLDLMDKWAEKYINLRKATSRKNKQGDRVTFRLQVRKNLPISPPGEAVEGIDTKSPFYVSYTKEPQKRSFVKEPLVTSRRSLSDKDVIDIGMSFIKENKFCKITDNDKLGTPLVLSRKRYELKSDMKQGDALTISQRVEFKREFFDFEVINSKQIVDIHPDTREIMSYKNIMWTAVDETSGRSMPYISQQEVVAQIDSVFAKSKAKYKVIGIKSGMYQTDKIIFPVLVVYTEYQLEEEEGIPEERVLVINLVKGLDLGKEKKEVRRPTKAG